MNIKYFILKGKKKYQSVYVRFWDSKRIDQKTRTGISVKYDDWSFAKQRLKLRASSSNVDFLNSQLNGLEDYIYDKYNKDYNNKEFISAHWLKDTVKSFFGRVDKDEEWKIYYVDWIERFVETAGSRLHNGKPIKPRSVKNYTGALNKLKDFEEFKGKKYRFEEIDLDFHRDFISYCSTEARLNNNSIGNLISRIKTFCRELELQNYPINPIYKSKSFYRPKNETFDIYLNNDEINSIYEHDFSDNAKLDNARDLFIIGLRTGLRISDFLRLSTSNLHGNVINITTKKTSQNLTIPFHPQVKEILRKRNGKLPAKMSDQKFNLYIKQVCKEAQINDIQYGSKRDPETNRKINGNYPKYELVSSHICRRSFATNLFLKGIDYSVIMRATGHKSIKQFINYVKATHDEHIKKLSEYWEKQTKGA